MDWLILILVVALLTGGAWWFDKARMAKGDTVSVIYTLSLLSVPETVAEANGGWETLMPTGAAVTNERGSRSLGTIERFAVRESLVATVADGEAVFIEQNGHVDLYVRVRAKALYREDDCYRVGDLPILCGTVGDFRIGSYLARGCRIVRMESVVEP